MHVTAADKHTFYTGVTTKSERNSFWM